MSTSQPIDRIPTKRIHDIDALRGITLLGILIVHTRGLFGYVSLMNTDHFSVWGVRIAAYIEFLLSNRFAPVFTILFGVSFYLILKNPNYTGRKFVWRCVLLIGIGLFNKLFYTYDVLMWYGIWGIALVLLRNLPPRKILTIAIMCYILSRFLSQYKIGNLLFSQFPQRYTEDASLSDIISYPLVDSIFIYFKHVFNGGIFGSFSLMAFGYWIGKKGMIENIRSWATLKTVSILFFIYAFLYGGGIFIHLSILVTIGKFAGALFMATIFLYIYQYFKGMKFLEAYGRMGLTNYSCQSIFGVILMSEYFIPKEIDFTFILAYFLLFFGIQALFSYIWLKYFKYGPMEYIWRSLVNMKFSNPFKSNSSKKLVLD